MSQQPARYPYTEPTIAGATIEGDDNARLRCLFFYVHKYQFIRLDTFNWFWNETLFLSLGLGYERHWNLSTALQNNLP